MALSATVQRIWEYPYPQYGYGEPIYPSSRTDEGLSHDWIVNAIFRSMPPSRGTHPPSVPSLLQCVPETSRTTYAPPSLRSSGHVPSRRRGGRQKI